MKKILATISCLVALTVAAIPVNAQKRPRSNRRAVQERRYNQRFNEAYRDRVYRERVYNDTVYNDSVYNDSVYNDPNDPNDPAYTGPYGTDDRSRWEKSRDKITTITGAAGGAVLGGLIGGKKGAILGAIAGGSGAAIYTYKIRDKENEYRY